MRRNWIKLYVDQCLRGSMFDELRDPAERFVFFGILLLAGDSPIDGKVCLTAELGYSDEQIAALLKIDAGLMRRTKSKMEAADKIRVAKNNIIEVVNWSKYQSEYNRQKPYREDKLQAKVTNEDDKTKLLLDRDREGDRDKKEKKEKSDGRSGPLSEPDIDERFKEFWEAYPREGRLAKKESRVKFGALVRRGELPEFIKGFNGYSDYLKHQKVDNRFEQRPMYAKTFLNGRWQEFVGFRYRNPL